MIAQYREEVVELINGRFQLTLPVSPELALLGIQDDDQKPCCTFSFLLCQEGNCFKVECPFQSLGKINKCCFTTI